MKKRVGLRIDVDFAIGLMKGVPFLLDFFEKKGITATFYVTMGPDGFKKSRKRLATKGYLKRIIAFNPLKILYSFGPNYIVRQFLGQSSNVGVDHPDILRKIIQSGHEIGIHGFDHFWWAENIWQASQEAILQDMQLGFEAFRSSTGFAAQCVWAAPNWRCSQSSLEVLDGFGLAYAADCRGRSPFFPECGGYTSKTMQLPVSLPCLHEVKQHLQSPSHEKMIDCMIQGLNENYNVLCLHAYYEGILERPLFSGLMHRLFQLDYTFVPLRSIAESLNSEPVTTNKIIRKKLPGGRGDISFQGERIA